MRNLVNSFEFAGLLCFPRQAAPPSYYFVPLHADLDRSDSGYPMWNLIAGGATGYLMFTAVWRATDQALEALRAEIARRNEIANPSTIQLALAPVQVARCDLLMGDGSGQYQVIATSSTSGMPPYAALFNVALTAEQFAAVAAAVNGNPKQLVVEYAVSLSTPVTGNARLIPQSSRFVPWLREYLAGGPVGFRAAIQEAIEEGLAVVQLELPEQPSEEMISTLYDRVLTRATELLPTLIEAGDTSTTTSLEVAVTLVGETRQPFQPRVDFAVIDLPKNQIAVAASTTGGVERMEKKAPPLRVKLDFDPSGAPLAWVRLQKGNAEVVLKPPQFGPATLPAGPASQPLRVTVGYSDGTQTYKNKLVPTSEKESILRARDLGLTMLMVDARPLAEAGVRSAQIWLHYGPPHRRLEQRQTIQFGADNWVAYWWLATPTQDALRFLDYRWQAVCADGRLSNQTAAYSGSSDIVLSFSGDTTDVTNR